MHTHTHTYKHTASPLRRRDGGGTSYIIYVDIILTTCVEYYTECVMSLIDPATTGRAMSSNKSLSLSRLYIMFFFSEEDFREKKQQLEKSHPQCATPRVCAPEVISYMYRVTPHVCSKNKTRHFIYNRKLNVAFAPPTPISTQHDCI